MTICNKVTEVFANANASVKYLILNRMAMRKTAVLVARTNDPFNWKKREKIDSNWATEANAIFSHLGYVSSAKKEERKKMKIK